LQLYWFHLNKCMSATSAIMDHNACAPHRPSWTTMHVRHVGRNWPQRTATMNVSHIGCHGPQCMCTTSAVMDHNEQRQWMWATATMNVSHIGHHGAQCMCATSAVMDHKEQRQWMWATSVIMEHNACAPHRPSWSTMHVRHIGHHGPQCMCATSAVMDHNEQRQCMSRQSQSYITTDNQAANPSWCQDCRS
jgi:hypothetical protein